MTPPLDDLYLEWLYSQLGSVRTKDPTRTYWSLVRQLFRKEFVWFVPNDDNRVEDGRYLRYEFIENYELHDVDPDWMGLGCSMLEMLLGMARRLEFEGDGTVKSWFWRLIENIGLTTCVDSDYNPTMERAVEETLDRVIWRTYNRNGTGGLFPLRRAKQDQRNVELWYQLSAYLLERV